jgi:hypothetical protein
MFAEQWLHPVENVSDPCPARISVSAGTSGARSGGSRHAECFRHVTTIDAAASAASAGAGPVGIKFCRPSTAPAMLSSGSHNRAKESTTRTIQLHAAHSSDRCRTRTLPAPTTRDLDLPHFNGQCSIRFEGLLTMPTAFAIAPRVRPRDQAACLSERVLNGAADDTRVNAPLELAADMTSERSSQKPCPSLQRTVVRASSGLRNDERRSIEPLTQAERRLITRFMKPSLRCQVRALK